MPGITNQLTNQMTICVAAIAGSDYAVVASDRMVTLIVPSTEYEQGLSKTLSLTDNCVASTAGSALAYTPVHVDAKIEIQKQNTHDIKQIAEIIRNQYVIKRNQKLDQDILGKIGLNLQTFYNINRTIAPEIVAQIYQGMVAYSYQLSILVSGVDLSGPHIYRIDNPGRMEIFDAIGNCAVGSGELHAISTFVANDYTPNLDLNHVVALTYEAKKRSEKAQGVGEQTDICIVCKDRTITLPHDMIDKLDAIYNKKNVQEKKVVSDIEQLVKDLNLPSIDMNESHKE
jgi:hypothetical protein